MINEEKDIEELKQLLLQPDKDLVFDELIPDDQPMIGTYMLHLLRKRKSVRNFATSPSIKPS